MERVTEDNGQSTNWIRWEFLTTDQFKAMVGEVTYAQIPCEFGPSHNRRGNYVQVWRPDEVDSAVMQRLESIANG